MGVDEGNIQVMIIENCRYILTSTNYGVQIKETCIIITRLAKSGSTDM